MGTKSDAWKVLVAAVRDGGGEFMVMDILSGFEVQINSKAAFVDDARATGVDEDRWKKAVQFMERNGLAKNMGAEHVVTKAGKTLASQPEPE